MAKPNYQYEKRQKELAKKQKKAAKEQKKANPGAPADGDVQDDAPRTETPEGPTGQSVSAA